MGKSGSSRARGALVVAAGAGLLGVAMAQPAQVRTQGRGGFSIDGRLC